MVNGSRIVGPAVAGLVIATVGEAWCFTIDAVSYVAVIASLLMMRVTPFEPRATSAHLLADLKSGFDYVAKSEAIRTPLLLLAVVSTMSMPYSVLMPAIAADVLHGGPHTLGWLMTSSGVGALAGGLYLAWRQTVLGLGRVMLASTVLLGTALIAFAASRVLWLSVLLLPLVGGGFMVQLAATNTVLQTIVDEDFRGRVLAYYAMSFFGGAPLGSLIAGVLADRVGSTGTIAVGGVACLVAAAWFGLSLKSLRKVVRPIYLARGVITASELDAGTH
jgi:predicted MFS family arabinose efflux permease